MDIKNKRSLFLFTVLLVFFSLVNVSLGLAAETEFTKNSSSFDKGETLIMSVSGNFVDQITRDNVFFYRDHERDPTVFDIEKINDGYYIYAELDVNQEPGNYSVRIEGVRYMLGTQTTDEDIVTPFTVSENTSDFYVTPGFISTSGDFSLQIQNLKSNKITVSLESQEQINSIDSLELVSGEIRQINFQVNEDSETFLENIFLSSENTSYSVPIYFESSNGEVKEEEKQDFRFEPNSANVSIPTNSDSKRIIYIMNKGSLVENISLSVSSSLEPYVNITPEYINSLQEGQSQKIEINIFSGEDELDIEGNVLASSENVTAFFTLSLNFIKDFIPEDENETDAEDREIITTCEQLGGLICGDEEKCSGETLSAKDGICCLNPAVCEEVEKSNTGKIIGWGIVILVLILLFWFFKKYKKARPKKDILSLGRGKK